MAYYDVKKLLEVASHQYREHLATRDDWNARVERSHCVFEAIYSNQASSKAEAVHLLMYTMGYEWNKEKQCFE